jgi:hypothetical protein
MNQQYEEYNTAEMELNKNKINTGIHESSKHLCVG